MTVKMTLVKMASFCGIGLGVKKGHKIHSFPNARPLKKLSKLNGKNFKSRMKPLGTDLEEKEYRINALVTMPVLVEEDVIDIPIIL